MKLQIGVVPALINFNLRLQPLKHSIEVAKSKSLIYGHELSPGECLLRDNDNKDILK
jgi:hypothetical protein